MKQKIVIGNWKNYLTEGEERRHYKNKELLKELKEISKKNSKK